MPHLSVSILISYRRAKNGGAAFDEIRRAFADAVILPEDDIVAGNCASKEFLQKKSTAIALI